MRRIVSFFLSLLVCASIFAGIAPKSATAEGITHRDDPVVKEYHSDGINETQDLTEIPDEENPAVLLTENNSGVSNTDTPNYGYIPDDTYGNRAITDAYLRGDTETYNHLIGRETVRDTLPSRYDSRDYNYVTPVRDQGIYGTCWAHAAMACVESYMIKHHVWVGNGSAATTSINLSESQHAFFAYTDAYDAEGMLSGDKTIPLDDPATSEDESNPMHRGGNGRLSAMTLMRWTGAADESVSALAYSNAGSVADSGLDSCYAYSSNVCHVQNCIWIPASDTEDVKRAIMEYGAGGISFYAHMTGPYVCVVDGERGSNHMIAVVGWDDSISVDRFAPDTPDHPGAWICKNSWGNTLDNGYCYISYEDAVVRKGSICFFDAEPIDNYDHNYQYDGTGNVFYRCGFSVNNVRAANVFTANGAQLLEAVAFCTFDEALSYTIEVFQNPAVGNPSSGILMTSKSGTLSFPGYYTIRLDDPVALTQGDTFSVVVTYSTPGPDSQGRYVYIPYDATYSPSAQWISYTHTDHGSTSYYQYPGYSWYDCPGNGDFRIKAYTRDTMDTLCIVSFHANGGSVTPTSKTVICGDFYGNLPVPTRDEYSFDGWFTAADGGDQVTALTRENFGSDHTLYAHWTKNPHYLDINENTFPDDVFRQWVIDNLDVSYDPDTGYYMTRDQTRAVRTIECNNCSISSLQGIEHFPLVYYLNCADNQLTELNVGSISSLNYLYCQNNQLTVLNVSSNAVLIYLLCYGNQLTVMDVSSNPNIKYLYCNNNRLTTLDTKGCSQLIKLICYSNQLTEIDVTDNIALQSLYCNSNQLTEIDVSQNTDLLDLNCSYNQLGTLDICNNSSLTTLRCQSNRLTELDVSGNQSLQTLDCRNNSLPWLDLSQNDASMECSLNGQTIKNQVGLIANGTYSFDLRTIMPEGCIQNVTLNSSNCELDTNTGKITFSIAASPFSYKYSVGQSSKQMEVWIYLTFESAPAPEPAFKTQALTLEGKIGVDFFVDLPQDDAIEYEGVAFTIDSIDGADAFVPFGGTDHPKNGSGYYKFTYYVRTIEMANTITATLRYTLNGEAMTLEKTYSVKQYFDTFDQYISLFSEKQQNMTKATADLGHYIQAFLAAQKGWTFGTDYAEMDKHYADYTADDISAAQGALANYAQVKLLGTNMQKITYTLVLDSDTELRVYFKPAASYTGTFTFTVNGNPIAEDGEKISVKLQSDGRYLVSIKNIGAHELSNMYRIVAQSAGSEAYIELSTLSYANAMMTAYEGNTTALNAAVAIYRYAMAANALIN